MKPADAIAALSVFALDPFGAGLILRGAPCPARDAILDAVRASLAPAPLRRLPPHIAPERLAGGVDVATSLAAGRLMALPGVLQGAGSVVVLTMAERWDGLRAGMVAQAMDAGAVGVVACDEGVGADESLPAGLADRCACRIDLTALPEDFAPGFEMVDLPAARARRAGVTVDDGVIAALCRAAEALGAGSPRAAVLATGCARALAALAGRGEVSAEDAAQAARLVLSPRATRQPPEQEAPAEAESPAETQHAAEAAEEPNPPADQAEGDDAGRQDQIDDLVLDATRIALPADLLAARAAGTQRTARSSGRAGETGAGRGRGRPAGSRAGTPRDGLRLDLVGTLCAAAPWQGLRGRAGPDQMLRIRRDDLRVVRCKRRTATLTVFAVDASGSLALSRLADVKGAVELLLAECYIRRDSIALIAFRGRTAELLLPPTRAPARAKRCLAELAGGGGTPLASGILAATALADAAARRGETPTIVLLTDGQANVSRAGAPGRAAGRQDALEAARNARLSGHRALLIDTAPRRAADVSASRALATAMGARYLCLPRADARSVSDAVRAARA